MQNPTPALIYSAIIIIIASPNEQLKLAPLIFSKKIVTLKQSDF